MPEPSERRFGDRADVTALLGAFCFFLSAIEYMIPKPLPFMRLGIANLPILLAADLLPLPWFLVLALVKVVGMSVISGSLFSYIAIFSLAGTVTAAIVMWTARKAFGNLISAVGVSVLGAVSSNAIQVLIARAVVFGEAAKLIAPAFLAMGLVTGALLGLFAEAFAAKSSWYARAKGQSPGLEPPRQAVPTAGPATVPPPSAIRPGKAASPLEARFEPGALALAGAAISLAFLFQGSLALRAGMLVLFMAAAALSGKRISPIATILVSAGIVAANLLVPTGKVLARLGPLVVTQAALLGGVEKAVTFEGLVYLSKATIRPGLRLPGRFGAIVGSAFVYYDRVVEYKGKLKPATLVADADELMLRVWEEPPASGPAGGDRPRGSAAGWAILAAATAAAYAALFINRL